MPGAGGQPQRAFAEIADGRGKRILQSGIAGDRVGRVEMIEPDLEFAGEGNAMRFIFELRHRGMAKSVFHATQIDREIDASGNDIGGAWFGLDAADGCHHVIACKRETLGRQRHLGGARQRIAPQGHRHSAGMARLSGDGDAKAALPNNTGDHAERLVFGLQKRPLFDMDLDVGRGIGARVGGLRNVFDVLAIGFQRLGKGDAVAIGELESFALEYASAGRL
jgi:hypothetical protein